MHETINSSYTSHQEVLKGLWNKSSSNFDLSWWLHFRMPSLLPKSCTWLALTLRRIPCWNKVITKMLDLCWSEQIWLELHKGMKWEEKVKYMIPVRRSASLCINLEWMHSDSAHTWPSPRTTLRVYTCSKLLVSQRLKSKQKAPNWDNLVGWEPKVSH